MPSSSIFIPYASNKSVLQISFRWRPIWKLLELREPLLLTFTAWSISPATGPGHPFSRAYGLLMGCFLGWPEISGDWGRLRKTTQAPPDHIYPLQVTSSTKAPSYLGPPSDLEVMEITTMAAKSKRSFAKSGLETRSVTICWSGPRTGGCATAPGIFGCVPTPVKLSMARGVIPP